MSNLVVIDGNGASADKKLREGARRIARLRRQIREFDQLLEDERRADDRYQVVEAEMTRMVDNKMDNWRDLMPELEQVGVISRTARQKVLDARNSAKSARRKLRELTYKPKIGTMEEEDEAAAEEGSGSFFSTARDARIAPMPRVTIIDMGESDNESIPVEEIPATFEIPDAYTRSPTLAIESRNDEDASFYSIKGLEEDSFHTVKGSGAAFSRPSRVAPTIDTQYSPNQYHPQAATDDAQIDMMGLPETFDMMGLPETFETDNSNDGSYDSYENYLQRRDDVEGEHQSALPGRSGFPYFFGR